jgi:hypothetical protein
MRFPNLNPSPRRYLATRYAPAGTRQGGAGHGLLRVVYVNERYVPPIPPMCVPCNSDAMSRDGREEE